MGSMIKLFGEQSSWWIQLAYVVLLLVVVWLIYDYYMPEHLSGSKSWRPSEVNLSAVAMGR